jgi:hypothetical protein
MGYYSAQDKDWFVSFLNSIAEKHGEKFAERCKQHIEFVCSYKEYGAPSHMNMVIIKYLIKEMDTHFFDKS